MSEAEPVPLPEMGEVRLHIAVTSHLAFPGQEDIEYQNDIWSIKRIETRQPNDRQSDFYLYLLYPQVAQESRGDMRATA